MSYPAINGYSLFHEVTFSGFQEKCGKRHRAIMTNSWVGDILHPVDMRGVLRIYHFIYTFRGLLSPLSFFLFFFFLLVIFTSILDNKRGIIMHWLIYLVGLYFDSVDQASRLLMEQPTTQWINPSDCVDMDCDARRQQLVRDLDGSFTGSVGGTVISMAEYEWDGNKRYGLGTIFTWNLRDINVYYYYNWTGKLYRVDFFGMLCSCPSKAT